jgi:hypothetical protein
MAPPIVTATIQTAIISAFSNILAQAITAHQTNVLLFPLNPQPSTLPYNPKLTPNQQTHLVIDWIPVFQYLLFALISTPPNFLWQDFLESTFPAYHMAPTREALASAAAANDAELDDEAARGAIVEPRLNKRNTLVKTLLDQTVGAAVNTLGYSMFIHGVREGMGHHYVLRGEGDVDGRAGPLAGLGFLLMGREVVRYGEVRWEGVWARAKGEFWGLVKAGWRFWPAVSLVNYVFLTSVEARSLVGAMAGLGWGIYLSMATA